MNHKHRSHVGEYHHHHHHHHMSSSENIGFAFVLNFLFTLIEIAGAVWTGSVAIMADAIHDLGDSFALAAAFFLEKLAQRGSNKFFSYGYRRLSLLSALITAFALVVGAIFIMVHAIPRLLEPQQPKAEGMFVLAILGVAINGYAAWRLVRGETMNERVLSWHLLEDLFGWVVILVSSVVMMFADIPILDPILSIFFVMFIMFGVMRSLFSTFKLFLQAAPDKISALKVHETLAAVDGVLDSHDIHIWSLDGAHHVLTCHVVVADNYSVIDVEALKTRVRNALHPLGEFHMTLEIESASIADCGMRHCVKMHS